MLRVVVTVAQIQPPKLVELLRVAYDFGKDKQRPESTLKVSPSVEAGMVDVQFEVTEGPKGPQASNVTPS